MTNATGNDATTHARAVEPNLPAPAPEMAVEIAKLEADTLGMRVLGSGPTKPLALQALG